MCFDNIHRKRDCPLIPYKHKKQLMYFRGANIRGPQTQEAVTNSQILSAYPGARQDHRNQNRKMPLS